jgi:6-phosphogluconolactonase (cycloisomerase 2 family)
MNPLRITASGTRAYLQTWYGEAVRFARNPTTGILSSPTVQGVLWNTSWIEFDSAGTYAYVATGNRWEGNRLLTAFSVDSATGGLAEIDSEYLGSLGPESTAPNRATSVVLHPNGKYLYSVFGNWQTSAAGAQVARMLVGSDGKLTPATPPFNDLTTQDNAATLVLASDGSALYAAQHTANKIVRFAVSSTNGSLTETGSFTGGFGPRLGATCKKAGVEHVYAGNYSPDDANLSQGTCGVWDVSFAGGTLQGSVQHGPSQHPELAGAWSVAADPACEYLFAAGAFSSGGTATSSGITFFRILADGSLAYLGNTPSKPNMTQNGMLSVSGDGRFLYSVEDYNVNWVHVFEIVR